MTKYELVLAAASQLSLEERQLFINELGATIPDEYLPLLSPEWRQEIGRRIEEVDSGLVKAIPSEEVKKDLHARFGLSDQD